MKSSWIPDRNLASLLLLLSVGYILVTPPQAWTRNSTKSSPTHSREILLSSTTPIWQLDLRGLGFAPLQQRYEGGESWFRTNALCFVGKDYAVVNFVTREVASGLPRRNSPDESLPYRLHALFLDASSGAIQATREWPTASQSTAVLPATQGNFIVLTPDKLWLYSADFRLLSERTLALSNRAHEGYWHFSYSPNGKSLLVMYGVNPSDVSGGQAQGNTLYYGYEWIALDDLRLLRSWQENGEENLWKGKEDFNVTGGSLGSIFNDQIIRPFYTGFLVRELDGPLRFVRFSRPVATLGAFQFLTSQLIISERQSVLGAHRKGNIALIRTNGEVLFQQEFSDRELLDWPRSSADGGRLALAIYRERGGSVALDIPAKHTVDRIMVYDVNARHWVCTIGAKSQGIKDLPGLALSPDGSALAIIGDDSKLRLYGLSASLPTKNGR